MYLRRQYYKGNDLFLCAEGSPLLSLQRQFAAFGRFRCGTHHLRAVVPNVAHFRIGLVDLHLGRLVWPQ